MTFKIQPLQGEQFAPLFDMDADALKRRGGCKITADECPGYPCRVSLADAEIGETVLLLNYAHLDVDSPFASKHAVYVRQGAPEAQLAPGEVPEMIATRLISVRVFDAAGFMRAADVVDGREADAAIETFLTDPQIEFVDLHFAKQGCFAARAGRAASG